MKLKTLKDLTIRNPNYLRKYISYEELKKEAIKWVKEWDKEYKEEAKTHVRGEHNPKLSRLAGKMEAVIELNNITEEDLKS